MLKIKNKKQIERKSKCLAYGNFKLINVIIVSFSFLSTPSLFQTGEFADITLTSGLDRYEAHLPLIQARLPNLYAACCSSGPQNDLGEHQEFDMRKTGVSPDDVHNFVE